MKKLYCLILSFSLALSPIAGADAKRVFAEASPSIIVVLVPGGQGSGVVVGEGVAVTYCHIIKDASEVHIRQMADAQGAESYDMNAEVIAEDEKNDLCLLYAEDLTKPPAAQAAKFGAAKGLVIGEEVYVIGAPQGSDLSLSRGVVAQLRGIKGNAPIVHTDAMISPGSSGGGMFNEYGDLIGIAIFKRTDGEGLNLAIPVERITDLMQDAHQKAEEKKAQAGRWQACMKNLQYQCVMALAQEEAQQVKKNISRASAWDHIAYIQAELGYLDDAEITAQQIGDDIYRVDRLIDIATKQAKAGYLNDAKITIDSALHMTRRIDNLFYRVNGLIKIATVQAQIENIKDAEIIIDNALNLVNNNDHRYDRDLALKVIAVAQAKIGKYSDAEKTIEQIKQIDDRDSALGEVVGVQAEIGDYNDAETTMRQIAGDQERAWALLKIVRAQAKSGDYSSAKKTASQIKITDTRAGAFLSIAVAYAEEGDFGAAMITGNRSINLIFLFRHISKLLVLRLMRGILKTLK